MDFFGQIVDDLSDIWTDIYNSSHAEQAKPVLRAIDKAIEAAAAVERERVRLRREASLCRLEGIAANLDATECDPTPQARAAASVPSARKPAPRALQAKTIAPQYAAE